MSTEENKTVVQQLLHVIEQGDVSRLNQIIAPNWVNHDPSLPPMQGYEGAKQLVMLFHSAFPDMHFEIEDMLAEGDKVACRFRGRGTNTGSFQGMPPTGRAVDITGTGILRVVDGKLTDNWVNFDALGLMQQLGVVPPPGGTS
jgi:predicted ester cyclase